MTAQEQIIIAVKALEIFAARHPRPPHVNIRQAAEMLKISAQKVSKMVRFGSLKKNDCGLIPITEIARVIALRDDQRAA